MSNAAFNRATHFSIVWAVTLAVITLVEWHSLDRDPLEQQIFSPFIQRDITVSLSEPSPMDELSFSDDSLPQSAPGGALQYEVEFHFNGLLFLAYFFVPVLTFHGIGLLAARIRRR